jgi:hypothetical protein
VRKAYALVRELYVLELEMREVDGEVRTCDTLLSRGRCLHAYMHVLHCIWRTRAQGTRIGRSWF